MGRDGESKILFPTMKSQGAAKNEANNAAQSAPVEKTVEKAIAEVKETYDFCLLITKKFSSKSTGFFFYL